MVRSSHRRAARGLFALCAAALSLAACASTAPSVAPEDPAAGQPPISAQPSAGAQPSPETPVIVPEILAFSATTTGGDDFEGADLLGTPTILWVWAEWCPFCRAEAPHVVDALDELPEGVQVIGLAGHSDVAAMRDFIDDHGLDGIPHLADPDGKLWARFGVTYQPALVLIDAQGSVEVVVGSVGKTGFIRHAESIA